MSDSPNVQNMPRAGARPSDERPVRNVAFYTKSGCHLCEHAEELLEDVQADYDLRITTVDITTDLALFARYRYEIPVIIVEGGALVSGRIDRDGLRHALESTA